MFHCETFMQIKVCFCACLTRSPPWFSLFFFWVCVLHPGALHSTRLIFTASWIYIFFSYCTEGWFVISKKTKLFLNSQVVHLLNMHGWEVVPLCRLLSQCKQVKMSRERCVCSDIIMFVAVIYLANLQEEVKSYKEIKI